jgi:HK97 family phage major capsid protein
MLFPRLLDYAAFYGPGTSYSPAGLDTLGVQTLGSSSTTLTQLHPDEMISLLKVANVPMTNVAWAMSPQMEAWLKGLKTTTGAWIFREEMVNFGTLAGYKYIVSTNIRWVDDTTDYADLWLGDFDQLLWGVGMDFELRNVRDTAVVIGGQTISTTQTDSQLITVFGSCDFNTTYPTAFVKGTFAKP